MLEMDTNKTITTGGVCVIREYTVVNYVRLLQNNLLLVLNGTNLET